MTKEHYAMKYRNRSLVAIAILLLLIICPVSVYGLTINGTLGSSNSISKMWGVAPSSAAGLYITYVNIKEGQYANGLYSIVHFDAAAAIPTYPAGTIAGNTTTFHAHLGAPGGAVVGNGTIGYQRNYNWLGTELPGTQWVVFSNLASIWAGDTSLYLEYASGATGFPTIAFPNNGGAVPAGGNVGFITTAIFTNAIPGTYISSQIDTLSNTYSFTKPSGLGISGLITKTVLGVPSPSRIFIYNGTGVQIASDITVNGVDLVVNTNWDNVRLSALSPGGNWFNTSLLFSSTAPPTPTAGGYAITVDPASITYMGTSQGTITSTGGSLASITDIAWHWSDDTGSYDFVEAGNLSRPLDYTKIGATWYGFETATPGLGGGYTLNKGATMPNPVTLGNISTSGVKTVECFVGTSDGNFFTLTSTITVSQGAIATQAAMIDWSTGNRLYYGTISFRNIATGVWTNLSPTTGGIVSASSIASATFNIYGSATGYTNGTPQLGVPARSTGIYSIFMYPLANATPAGTTLLYVTVEDVDTLAGISGAQVALTSIYNTAVPQLHSTTNGLTTFTTAANTGYLVAVTAPGYEGATGTTTVASDPMYSYHIGLRKITAGATPTAYPTNAAGEKVSDQEGNALAAFGQISASLQGWFNIGIGIITIWLLWILVYELTGGKVIDKLMRRGRR